jgi:omega-6 fatty acid desaturase (delta-12 desaturase)
VGGVDHLNPGAASANTWQAAIARHRHSSAWKANWQLINTLVPYALVWAVYPWCLSVSWWLVPPLVLLASGLLVRTFIIFHDCGHGSFFSSRIANDTWGCLCGLLTFTPYFQWRSEHAVHHGTAGDLDKRGTGDVWTMTVAEYLAASRTRRLAYRLARNPFCLLIVGPMVLFLVMQRFPARNATVRERHSVWGMNLAILLMGATLSVAMGTWTYLVFQLAILMVSGSAGVWLFYVQHQFERAYWQRGAEWDYVVAALEGSSYFKLPRILQWFSGNIGFHHIHHLGPRIPNYHLERCHRSEPLFSNVQPLTLGASFGTLGLHLWDESSRRLVGFRRLRRESSARPRTTRS